MTSAEQLASLQTWKTEFVDQVRRDRDAQQQTNADVEHRMRRLERALYVCTGLGIAAQIAMKVLFH